eukprot:14026364-Alexandrium_andersonii.AAC.1
MCDLHALPGLVAHFVEGFSHVSCEACFGFQTRCRPFALPGLTSHRSPSLRPVPPPSGFAWLLQFELGIVPMSPRGPPQFAL